MARGFGNRGQGSTDKFTFTLPENPLFVTFAARYMMTGVGGGARGRIFETTNSSGVQNCVLYWGDPTSCWVYSSKFDTERAWSIKNSAGGSLGASYNRWHTIVISHNRSTHSNVPVIWVNGARATLATITTGTGAGDATGQDLFIGNRADSTRVLDGLIAEFAMWGTNQIPSGFVRAYADGWASPFDVHVDKLMSYVTLESKVIDQRRTWLTPYMAGTRYVGGPYRPRNQAKIYSFPVAPPSISSIISGVGTSRLVLSLSRPRMVGESLVLNYIQPGDGLESLLTGFDLSSFSQQPVLEPLIVTGVNSGAGTDTVELALSRQPAAGETVKLAFENTPNAVQSVSTGYDLANIAGITINEPIVITGLESGSGTDTLTFTLSRSLADGEQLEFSYIQPGDGIEDVSGNDLSNVSSRMVYNPVYITGIASGEGSNELVLTLSRVRLAGETWTLNYTQPGNGIEDTIGTDLLSFSGQSILSGPAIFSFNPAGPWTIGQENVALVGSGFGV